MTVKKLHLNGFRYFLTHCSFQDPIYIPIKYPLMYVIFNEKATLT